MSMEAPVTISMQETDCGQVLQCKKQQQIKQITSLHNAHVVSSKSRTKGVQSFELSEENRKLVYMLLRPAIFLKSLMNAAPGQQATVDIIAKNMPLTLLL